MGTVPSSSRGEGQRAEGTGGLSLEGGSGQDDPKRKKDSSTTESFGPASKRTKVNSATTAEESAGSLKEGDEKPDEDLKPAAPPDKISMKDLAATRAQYKKLRDEKDETEHGLEMELAKLRLQHYRQLNGVNRFESSYRLGEPPSDLQMPTRRMTEEYKRLVQVKKDKDTTEDPEERRALREVLEKGGKALIDRLLTYQEGELKGIQQQHKKARQKLNKKLEGSNLDLDMVLSGLVEHTPAIRAFCELTHQGLIQKLAGYLDPVSLFQLGFVVNHDCMPPTEESKALLEALAVSLIQKTPLQASGCTLVNIRDLFRDPNHLVEGDAEKSLRSSFYHAGPRTIVDPVLNNDYYDSLDDGQKVLLNIQWSRKMVAMPKGNCWGDFYNSYLYGAYHYRGYGNREDPDIDDNCNHEDTLKLGAFTGNSHARLGQLLDVLMAGAFDLAERGNRRCILLSDVLCVAKGCTSSIEFTFPMEAMHSIPLMDGRAVSATLSELGNFESTFTKGDTDAEDALDDEWGKWEAMQKRLWKNYSLPHEEQVSRAQAVIQEHLDNHEDYDYELEENVKDDLQALDFSDDNDDHDDEEWLEQKKVTVDEIHAAVKSRRDQIGEKLRAFVTETLPSLEPQQNKPVLIGDGLSMLKACSAAINEVARYPYMISVSASLFCHQLIEDIGLGLALKPFLLEHPEMPVPFKCHMVLGKNGTTMVPAFIAASKEDIPEEGNDSSPDSDSDSGYSNDAESGEE